MASSDHRLVIVETIDGGLVQLARAMDGSEK